MWCFLTCPHHRSRRLSPSPGPGPWERKEKIDAKYFTTRVAVKCDFMSVADVSLSYLSGPLLLSCDPTANLNWKRNTHKYMKSPTQLCLVSTLHTVQCALFLMWALCTYAVHVWINTVSLYMQILYVCTCMYVHTNECIWDGYKYVIHVWWLHVRYVWKVLPVALNVSLTVTFGDSFFTGLWV